MSRVSRESGFTVLETLFVVGLIGVIAAIAIPMYGKSLSDFRLSGDARSLSNAIALAKMRAASNFSRVRLYAEIGGRRHRIEVWNKTTSAWVAEGGFVNLNTGVSFSFGVVGAAPPNTQTTIAQADQCTDNAGDAIANTACIMFNSRGVPIDASLASTGADALYLTDGSAVNGVTVAATGMLRMWSTVPVATPSWILN